MWRRWFCFSSWLLMRLLTAEGRASAQVLGVTVSGSGSDPGDLVSVGIVFSSSELLGAVRFDLLVPPLLLPDPETFSVQGKEPFVVFLRSSADTLSVVATDSSGLAASSRLTAHLSFRARENGMGSMEILRAEAITISDRMTIEAAPTTIPIAITPNALVVGNATGEQGDTIGVTLFLTTEVAVAGLQIQWGEEPRVQMAESSGRASHLPVYLSEEGVILLTDPTGSTSLAPGTQDVLHLEVAIPRRMFPGPNRVAPDAVIATGLEGHRVPIRWVAGRLDVVERPNRAPDLTLPDTIRFTEDVDQRWLIPGSDLDGDALDYRIDLNPEWLRLSGDELVGLARDEDVGHYDIVIRVSDGFVEAVDTLVASVVNVGPDCGDFRLPDPDRQTAGVCGGNTESGWGTHRISGGGGHGVRGPYRWMDSERPWPLSSGSDGFRSTRAERQRGRMDTGRSQATGGNFAEVMADPPKGLLGDTNRDGIRESGGDEYVEIVNEGDAPVAIGGWSLGDDDVKGDGTFRFPEGTFLGPRERLVLFGRPPVHALPFVSFGDDGKIGNGLGNRSERILLIDPSCHDTIDVFAYTLARSPGVALVRTEDGIVAHNSFPRNQTHSPGYPAATMVALVVVVPEQMTLGEHRAVFARALYSNGDLEAIDDGVEWASGSGLRVDDGMLQAVNQGTVEIFAVWQGYLASETVSVVPPVLPPMQLDTEPPERARVGAVYRYVPAIDYGEGAGSPVHRERAIRRAGRCGILVAPDHRWTRVDVGTCGPLRWRHTDLYDHPRCGAPTHARASRNSG